MAAGYYLFVCRKVGTYEEVGGSVLLVEGLGAMQGRILRKPKQYMRTLRRTSKDMPP